MTISLLCITNNAYEGTDAFIAKMRMYATEIGAEFVLGLDRDKAQNADFRRFADVALDLTAYELQEDVMNEAVRACSGEWVLRLDDDETLSPALLDWIAKRGHVTAGRTLYAFPRIYFYGDDKHFLVNDGMWPDLQTRLGRKELMYGYTYVHAGNPNGTGTVAPYALEHHKLLCRSYEERKAIADRYEALRKGAGSQPEYARYNLPELFYSEMKVKEYTNRGDFGVQQ